MMSDAYKTKGWGWNIWLSILLGVAGIAIGGYLLASARLYTIGFPLDDAWIHQTYARSLAADGQWAFLPGTPSAGSTSPLWTFCLAAGYFTGGAPYVWAFILGGLCLWALASIGEMLFRRQAAVHPRIPWAGLFLAGEWHLVWAAVSGMETALFAALILGFFWLVSKDTPRWGLAGLMVGLALWTRPDGISLLGPGVLLILTANSDWKERANKLFRLLGGAAGLIAAYFLFNYLLSGSLWPNTFHAKAAEYAILQQTPLLHRFIALARLPMIGPGILLLPGAVYALWTAWKRRNWVWAALFAWWCGYTLMYALRLPVEYQHGRYLMPAMPVYFIFSALGMWELIKAVSARRNRLVKVLNKVWLSSLAGVWMAFYVLGASAFAEDVAIIETEMVHTARWIAENSELNAVIAAHDIGALGYYGSRQLIDLAGLISPEVIPFIRDEEKLAAFLDQQTADYLVTFPGWYPHLAARAELVYSSGGRFSLLVGGENMAVYRWMKNNLD